MMKKETDAFLASRAYERHQVEWQHREPARVWEDQDGILCVEYADVCWWHYDADGSWR